MAIFSLSLSLPPPPLSLSLAFPLSLFINLSLCHPLYPSPQWFLLSQWLCLICYCYKSFFCCLPIFNSFVVLNLFHIDRIACVTICFSIVWRSWMIYQPLKWWEQFTSISCRYFNLVLLKMCNIWVCAVIYISWDKKMSVFFKSGWVFLLLLITGTFFSVVFCSWSLKCSIYFCCRFRAYMKHRKASNIVVLEKAFETHPSVSF